MKTSQTIRNLDEEVYRKFRGKCAELNTSTGDAVTEAMKMWLEAKKKEKR
jgi:plasmid stability protein